MGVGTTYYWDPINGNDSNDGLQPSTAVKNFVRVNQLVSNNGYDIVYCLATDPSGITTVTENLEITKNTLKLRGPGYSFQLKPTSTTKPTISINAHSIQISGLYIATAATGSQNAITIIGDNNHIKDCWIKNVRGNGISITASTFSKISNCVIENCGLSTIGDAIKLGDSSTQVSIVKNVITSSINGISISGTGVVDNIVENNLIYNNSGYGIAIDSSAVRTTVRSGNTITNNTLGNTQNTGVDTYIETPAGGASASDVADAVWDELVSSHTISGSAGKTLKDAKAKATLASLK